MPIAQESRVGVERLKHLYSPLLLLLTGFVPVVLATLLLTVVAVLPPLSFIIIVHSVHMSFKLFAHLENLLIFLRFNITFV